MTVILPAGSRMLRHALFWLALALATLAPPAQAQVYWRFDTGWSKARDAGFHDNDFWQSGLILGGSFYEAGRLDGLGESLHFGAGLGYRFSDSLRADVTVSYRDGYHLSGSDYDGFAPATYSAAVSSKALLVNGYYDFHAGGVRPYLGAGIGWARNTMGPMTQDWGFGFATTIPGATTTSRAFALMAGVGILVRGAILDVGYRYVDFGEFESGTDGWAPAGGGMPAFRFPYGGGTGKLRAHELTVGFRF